MKHLILSAFLFLSFNLSAQAKLNDKGEIVEVTQYELPTSTKSIDARIEGLKKSIESLQIEIQRLVALRKEVEALEGKSMKAQSKKKKK